MVSPSALALVAVLQCLLTDLWLAFFTFLLLTAVTREKQRETIRYLYDKNIAQQYDWIMKADTDSYVIVENLKKHLSKLSTSEPVVVGNLAGTNKKGVMPDVVQRMHLPEGYENFFAKRDKKLRWSWAQGAGYAMNLNFVEKLYNALDTPECLVERPDLPEDMPTRE